MFWKGKSGESVLGREALSPADLSIPFPVSFLLDFTPSPVKLRIGGRLEFLSRR